MLFEGGVVHNAKENPFIFIQRSAQISFGITNAEN